MLIRNYTYYRKGVSGEWSYQSNLEAFSQSRFTPGVLEDITNVESTLPLGVDGLISCQTKACSTMILRYIFLVPFFITSAARARYCTPDAETGLMQAGESRIVIYVVRWSYSIFSRSS